MNTNDHRARHRRPRRGTVPGRPVGWVSMVAAAAATGWFFGAVGGEPQASSPATAHAAAAESVPIEQTGQVVSVSENSLTTVAADGGMITFRITPETNRIGGPGSTGTTAPFVPTQRVVVLGELRDGVPVATAIADQSVVGPDGPPMDYGLPA